MRIIDFRANDFTCLNKNCLMYIFTPENDYNLVMNVTMIKIRISNVISEVSISFIHYFQGFDYEKIDSVNSAIIYITKTNNLIIENF